MLKGYLMAVAIMVLGVVFSQDAFGQKEIVVVEESGLDQVPNGCRDRAGHKSRSQLLEPVRRKILYRE